ncbi:MAG: response regulator [Candidatus Magnetominusculus sp. LBB02]|nr:response regulator [Candidatus Magnetominusculus sp. LBB02]
MRILIADDDPKNCSVLQLRLKEYGDCDIVVNGKEAFEAFVLAHEEGNPYDLICLDIMMPVMDGNEACRKIRKYEEEMEIDMRLHEAKIVMTTALGDPTNITKAFHIDGCTAYLVKPISKTDVIEMLTNTGLLS